MGLGEDGPTHQPVEHHMALRAIPNLWYIRPGDANETAMAWRIALERADGPVALALTRQKLPTLDRSEVAPPEGVLRGAYTLWQRDATAAPEAIVIATGSELHVALEGARARDRQRRASSRCRAAELFDAAARRLPRRGVAAGVERAAVGRSGHHPRLGAVRGDVRSASTASAPPPRASVSSRSWVITVAARRRRGARGDAAMRVAAAFDHRGVKLREAVLETIAAGDDPVDLGTDTDAVRIDYPDQALAVAMAIRRGEAERGVLVCGSGVGASIAASKIPRHSRRDLPRFLFGAPGRRAR